MIYEAPTIRLLGTVSEMTQTDYVEVVKIVTSVTDITPPSG